MSRDNNKLWNISLKKSCHNQVSKAQLDIVNGVWKNNARYSTALELLLGQEMGSITVAHNYIMVKA